MDGNEPRGGAIWWDRFAATVVRHRVPVLVAAVALTGLSAAVSPTIDMTSDPTAYLPRDKPEVDTWIRMNDRFGTLHTLMVGLEDADAPLSADALERVSRVTERLGTLKDRGVLLARSLTNVQTLRLSEDGTINAEPMVPVIPSDDQGLERLRTRILADMQVPGALVSRDLQGYMVLVMLDPRKDPREAARLVRGIVEEERGPLAAFYFGAPFISNMVTHNVYAKLTWIVPVFAVLLFGVILFRTRNLLSVGLVLLCSGLSLVWWLASMDLAGYALTMTSVNGLLLILVTAALTFARGAQSRLEGRANPLRGRVMLLLAGTIAAFGAIIVFGHLTPVSLPYLARLGEAMAIGMACVGAIGLFVFLPLASFMSPVLSERVERCPKPGGTRAYRALFALVVAVGVVGSTQARFATDLKELFTDSGEVGRTLDFFDRRFGGNEFVQVDVKGDFRDPAVASRVMRLTDMLEGSGAFADVRSISQVLGFLAHRFSGVHRIPGDAQTLNNVWFFLEGSKDIRPLVNDDRDEAMLALRVPSGGSATASDLVSAVQWAIDGSGRPADEAARLRLQALSRRYRLGLSKDRIDEAVSAALAPGRQSAVRDEKVEKALHEYMLSPESPYSPSDKDWGHVVDSLELGHGVEELSRVIAGSESFQSSGMPEHVAGALAETLIQRSAAMNVELRCGILSDRLFEGLDPATIPEQASVRAGGVFAELLAPPEEGGNSPVFTISGFPVILPLVESELLGGLWTTAGIIIIVCFLFSLLAAPRPGRAVAAAGEAVLATLLAFALCWALRIQIDSSSATLFLIAPMLMFSLSPSIHRTGDTEVRRFPVAFALGLAAAPCSLLFTGVLPVMRLGLSMTIGLTSIAIVASLSRRISGN